MSNLVIFDVLSVTDVNALIACLTPNTDHILMNFHEDNFETLKQKIGSKSYQNVSIARRNYERADQSLVAMDHLARITNVAEIDPELKTWKEHIEFFAWIRDNCGMQNLDLLECNLWSNEDWKYIINTMKVILNVNIRASLDITGSGGNWVLESDNVDTIGLYFTEDVKQYPHHLYQTLFYHYDQNNVLMLDGSGGTMFKSKYEGHVNKPYPATYPSASPTGGFITLPSDISNVIQVVSCQTNAGYTHSSAYAALRSDGVVVTWGEQTTFMYNRSSAYDASLSNVKRLYTSYACAIALKNDNSLIGWGNGSLNVSTAQTLYVETSYIKAMPASITNVKEIYVNDQAYCALKYNGTVEAWGVRYNGGDCSACQPLLVGVKKIVTSSGWGGFFAALRNDGNVVAWKGDVGAGMPSGFSTTIGGTFSGRVVDIFGSHARVYALLDNNVITSSAPTFYADARGYSMGFATAASSIYTLPAGVSIRYAETFSVSMKYHLSNGTVYATRGSTGFVFDSDQVITNQIFSDGWNFPIYRLNRTGSVTINHNGSSSGAVLNDATWGLRPGCDVSTNVVEIYTCGAGVAARKADGTFITWGGGQGGWPLRFDSSANGIRDVISVTEVHNGYKVLRTNNSLISITNPTNTAVPRDFRTTPFADLSNITFPANKNVWIFDNFVRDLQKELTAVELDPFESITPSTPFMRFQNVSVVYKSNNCFRLAKRGMKYGLYSGSTLLSTFAPIHNTTTYTFNNVQVPELGTVMLSIGLLSVNFQNTLFTFNVSTIENPFLSPPDAPSISGVNVNIPNGTASVNFTFASWTGGAPITAVKYSLNGGETFITASSLTSPLSLSGLTAGAYDFVLKTSNLIGDSYGTYFFIAMCDPPAAPVLTSVVGSNRTLTINFTPPVGGTYTPVNLGNISGMNSNTYTLSGNANPLLNGQYVAAATGYSNIAYTLFDGVSSNYWQSAGGVYTPYTYTGAHSTVVQNVGTISGEWFQLKYPNGILMTGYTFQNDTTNYFPANFWLVGSNNGTTWFPLDNRAGQWPMHGTTITYTVSDALTTGSFLYFRFIVTGLNWGDILTMRMFSIIGIPIASNTVIGYKYSLNGAAFVSKGTRASPMVISNLNNATTYNIALKAINAAGDSVASSTSSNVSIDTFVPEVPVITSCVVGNQTMTLQITAPYNGGSAITAYQYSVSSAAFVNFPNMSSPFVVSGLANGVEYDIRVRAVNSVGASVATQYISGLIPRTVPNPPIVLVSFGDRKLIVSYNPSGTGGSAITQYKYSLNGGAFIVAPNPGFTISDLVNGTEYTVLMKAVNVAGESAASIPTSATPCTIASIPNITTISVANKKATIFFNQSSNGNGKLLGYQYGIVPDNSIKRSLQFANSNLRIPNNADMQFGTGDFTVEWWQYQTWNSSNGRMFHIGSDTQSDAMLGFRHDAHSYGDGGLYIYRDGNGVHRGNTEMIHQWSHVSINRVAGVMKTYINGSLFDTIEDTLDYTTTKDLYIGSAEILTSENAFNGYMYGFTMIKGVGVRTGTFTPPLTPITSVEGGIVVLSLTGNAFLGTLGSSIVNSGATTTTILPKDDGNSHSCMYFDDNRMNQINIPNNAQLNFGTGDFTISWWAYGGTGFTFHYGGYGEYTSMLAFHLSRQDQHFYFHQNGSIRDLGIMGLGGFNHYAICRISGTTRIFINGSIFSSFADTTNYTSNANLVIGTGNNHADPRLNAVLTGFVWVKGHGMHDQPFIPMKVPIMNVPAPGILVLSLDGTNSNGTLGSTIERVYLRARYDMFPEGYGNVNNTFSMVGWYNRNLFVPQHNDLNMGSGDFTIEWWQNANMGDTMYPRVFQMGTDDNASALGMLYDPSGFSIIRNGAVSTTAYAGFLNKWLHIAICKSNSVMKIYIQGEEVASYADTNTYTNTEGLGICRPSSFHPDRCFSGNMIGFAIVKGAALYSANFSPRNTQLSYVSEGTLVVSLSANTYLGTLSSTVETNNMQYTSSVPMNYLNYNYKFTSETTSPISIPDLKNGSSYAIIIKAANVVGVSYPSAVSSVFTPMTLADAPIVEGITVGNASASLVFSSPAYDGGNAITGYKLVMIGGSELNLGLVSSPYNITGLTNGQTYSFQLKAVNAMGASEASNASDEIIPFTVPSAPTVSVSEGDQTLSFQINAGFNGGRAISSYTYVLNDAEPVVISSPDTIEVNATIGSAYTFSVYSTNEAGNSVSGSASATGKSVPDAPVIDTLIAGNKSAKIVFTAGVSNYSAITGYKYKLDSGAWVVASLDASGRVLVSGLTENVEYSVILSAINVIGQSVGSNAVSVVPYAAPAAPTINSIVSGNGTATISITAGVANSSEITTFKYSLNNSAYVSLPDLSTLFSLSDLSNGILYNIKVKTTNAGGDSASASQNFMPYTVPEPPVITSVTAGNEEADINFIPGFFNGSNITGYKYAINGGVFDGTTFVDAPEISSPIHISGLVNGTIYTVNLISVNEAGESNASNSSSSFAPFVTQSSPNPPLLQSVSVGNQSASIEYTDDYNPGSAIIGYKHSLNGETYLWFAQNSSPMQLTGLENGTEYTMYVKAVNNSGASIPSLPITFTPSAEPSAPVILNAVGGDGQMTLFVEESETRGSAITYVHCSLNGGEFFTVDVSGSQVLLEGLDNGIEYVAVLKSENAIGMSDESNASETVIPVGLPFPPSITNIVVGDKQVTVEFDAADGNGAELLKYSYCIIANGVAGLYLSTEDLTSPIVIEGLTNGVEYSIRMKSLTKEGESAPTDESEAFMPFGLPEAPIITGTFFENGILSVHFSEQQLNGKIIVDHLYSLDEGTTFFSSSQTASPLSIPNLAIGATTTICIKTVTEAGTSTVSNISPEIMAYTAPSSPVITSITSQNKALTVHFVDGEFNGTVKIGYKYKLNDAAEFYWCNTDVSPIVIADLENGTPYTVSMKVVTNQGNSDVYTFETPVIPSNLQLPPAIISVDASNSSIIVSFKNPELNGATITGYKFAVNNGEFADVSVENWDVSNNKITIAGLSNGTSYTAALKSISSNGVSTSSNVSKSVSAFANPSPPVISRVVTGSQVAFVHFTDGSLNGSPAILGYKYSLDGTNYTWSSVTSSPIPLTGLTNNLAYTIRVMAITSVNSSAPSAASTLFVPYTLPEPPTINSVSVSNGTATISYTNGLNNGRPFTGYTYSLNGSEPVAIGLQNPFTVAGLTNGLTYLATMCSVNAAGTSVGSSPSPTFVPYTVPGAPVISSIVPSDSALTVNVSNPNLNGIVENGINIIGYSYSFNNSTFTFVPTSNNATSFNITGLVNGTTYQVYIKSVTNIGLSPTSTMVSGAPRTSPSPVTITSVTAGNKSVSVAFIAGTSNGAAITGYKYSLDGTNYVAASQTSSPLSIFNLVNGITYRVYIKASNAAGDASASLVSSDFMPFATLTPPLITSIDSKNMGATINVNNTYYGTLDGSGIDILGYKYSFNDLSYVDVSTNSPTSFDISGLDNGSSYSVYVKTITNIGTSSASLQSDLFFARSTPDAPTIASVEASDARVFLSFTDGSNNGAAITGYKYSLDGTTYYTALQKTSPLTLFSLDNALPYQVYLKAVNAMGDSANSNLSDAVVPFGNPFAPFVTKIVPGNLCAYVHFEPINTNGSPIIKIKYTLGAASMDAIGIESPVTIPNLTNKLVYNVSVIATNFAGDSYASNSMPVIVGSPTIPEVTSIVAGAKHVKVYFEMPIDNGLPITQFSYTTVGSTKYAKGLGLTSPLTIAGLTNGTPYNIIIAAVNKNGQSSNSTPMGNRTPFDIPGKFTITSVVPRFNGATINFALPAINGSAITRYAYSMVSTDPISSFIDLSGTTSPLLLDDIPNNTTYSIRMVAYNEAGPSPITVGSKPVSFKYLPPAIPKITGVTPAFQKLFVNFIAPAIFGSPITTYKYALNNSPTYIDATTNTIPLMIHIDNNVAYTVKIIASSAAGDSAPSASSVATTFVYLPPDLPVVTNIIAGNQSANIVFTTPKIFGAAITTYKYSLDGGVTKTDLSELVSPLTITGLTNDVSYNVLMYANSGAGLSPPSVSRPVIPMYARPTAPTIKTVVVSTVNASIGYTLGSANGAPITNVLYSLGTEEFTDAGSINGSLVLTGLTSKQNYSIRLIAVNEVGQSLPTAPKPFTMK